MGEKACDITCIGLKRRVLAKGKVKHRNSSLSRQPSRSQRISTFKIHVGLTSRKSLSPTSLSSVGRLSSARHSERSCRNCRIRWSSCESIADDVLSIADGALATYIHDQARNGTSDHQGVRNQQLAFIARDVTSAAFAPRKHFAIAERKLPDHFRAGIRGEKEHVEAQEKKLQVCDGPLLRGLLESALFTSRSADGGWCPTMEAAYHKYE